MGGRGGGIVTRIYDEYGITGTGVKRVAQRVGEVTGEVFSLHYSDVKGDYYLSGDWPRREITVQSNELEDEDGKYLLMPDHAEYPVLLFARDGLDGECETSLYLDELRDKLSSVEGLVFLHRHVSHSPEPPELSLEEELRILRDETPDG
jgi:hypothetical protein